MPVVPKTQGLHSSTFHQPPLDGSLSLSALTDWQATHSPDHPLFVFEDAPGSLRTIRWNEGVQGINRAAHYVRRSIGKYLEHDKPIANSETKRDALVVAVLATSDTIPSFCFIHGILRSGLTIFMISPRNSAPAIAVLLAQTNAAHLFVSSEPAIQSLAAAALKELKSENSIQKHEMPVFEDLFPAEGIVPEFVPEPLANIDQDSTAIILHSSGTTSFPKPIYITHKALLWNSTVPCYGEVDLAGRVLGCHSIAMFHAFGLFVLVMVVSTGMTAATFKPHSPATIPNPVNVFEGVVATKCDLIACTPTFLETWSCNANYMEFMAKMMGIIADCSKLYSGGPLNKEVGDYLVSKSVNICNMYGSTESLSISEIFPREPSGTDWEYFPFSPVREIHFKDHGNNEFEPVILATDHYRPNAINTQIDERDAYSMGDLVAPHPRKVGYWKVIGRTDDQIMHSTGEKTNPGPLERILNQDPLVHGAVMFGRGRFHCGVLVQPKEPFIFDPSDTRKLVEFRSLIWPTIESMNAYAPTHSRIFKEMILVASPAKPLTYTPKGTVRRQAIIDDYKAEIDAIYAAVDESAQEDIAGPVDWSLPHVHDFVRQVVEKTMKRDSLEIADDADLFEFGLDSLQATWIRNSLLRVVREKHPTTARKLSANFVYDHPTISGLAAYLSASVTGRSLAPPGGADNKRRELQALVAKYTYTFPEFKAGQSVNGDGDVVLLTGSTGSLGSNVLAKLIENPGVKLVYAMSRPSPDDASVKERHLKAFERENLDVKLLHDDKVRFLEGDAGHADFAIDSKHFEEMQSSVTHIIHNAWRVNFNIAVTSFETNIRSVRNFIDFSLGGHGAAPARMLFISSIGVFQNYNGNGVAAEQPLEQPDSALGTGYAESKWVSEQILEKASTNTPLSTTVVRCGQMTGGPSGSWNEHEWFPSVIKSSIALGKLPDVEGSISWVTAYDAAGAVVDMLHTDERVLHLIHPRPVPWSSIIAEFAKALGLPPVSYAEWLSALEQAHTELYSGSESADAAAVERAFRENPALRLLSFFRAANAHAGSVDKEPFGIPRLACGNAVGTSPTLRDVSLTDAEDVNRWVANWRKTGFIV